MISLSGARPGGRGECPGGLVLDQGDGGPWLLLGQGRAVPVSGLGGRSGLDCGGVLAVDFDRPNGVGLLRVEGEAGFVPLAARKRLEERGELTEGDRLIILDRVRRERYLTSILYRILPEAEYAPLWQACHTAGFFLHDTFSLLLSLLRRLPVNIDPAGPTEHVLLALRTRTGLSVLGGTRREPMFVRRWPLSGPGREDAEDVLAQAVREMSRLVGGHGGETVVLWLEAACEDGCRPPQPPDCRVLAAPLADLFGPDGPVRSSLPWAVALAGGVSGHGPDRVRWFRRLAVAERWLWGGLAAASVFFLLGSVWLTQAATSRTEELAALRAGVANLEAHLTSGAPAVQAASVDVQTALTLADDLAASGPELSLSRVLADISASRPAACRLDGLEADYASGAPVIGLRGLASGDPPTAGAALAALRSRLAGRGWRVEDKRIEAGVEGSYFTLGLTLPREGG